jgi:hypothetical protein
MPRGGDGDAKRGQARGTEAGTGTGTGMPREERGRYVCGVERGDRDRGRECQGRGRECQGKGTRGDRDAKRGASEGREGGDGDGDVEGKGRQARKGNGDGDGVRYRRRGHIWVGGVGLEGPTPITYLAPIPSTIPLAVLGPLT